jgi:hypothetical protein
MPYFRSPCSLPQNRVLLPCRTAEICPQSVWLLVIKYLIYIALSTFRSIGVLLGIDLFPGFSRAAGKQASTAFATMPQLRLEAQKKMLTFLASNTFWSRVILRPAIFQAPATRRSTSRRAPT